MRFLCLHGAGTNNRIFELQTAALRYELGSEHSFEFVEGSIPCPKIDGIESLAAADDEFFAYFNPAVAETFKSAVRDLHDYLVEEGPFDAVIAFSQGCALAASFIITYQSEKLAPHWKFAIFFSGEPGSFIDGQRREGIPLSERGIITIPTLHCWGAKDTNNPTQNAFLSEQCHSESRSVFVHQGGHEIPGSNRDGNLVNIVHKIRRLW